MLKCNMINALICILVHGHELDRHNFSASILLWQEIKAYHHMLIGIPCEHDDIKDFIEVIECY